MGLLKTVSNNKQLPLPIKLFEVSDIVTKWEPSDVGAKNQRRIAVLHCDVQAGFEKLHGVLDLVMMKLGVRPTSYSLDPDSCVDEALFPGMRSNIVVNHQIVGMIGVLHPEVLVHFGISYPVSVCEIDLEGFV